MCSARGHLSVMDVYDVAGEIGKEFEKLINVHGPESIESLMQNVINVLEHLESAAEDRAHEDSTIERLQSTIKHYELIEAKKNEERLLQSKELEQIEEHYKQETRDLLSTVKRLQDENRKLQSSLTAATEKDSAFSEDDSYFEVDLVNRLQNVIEKQRSQIKSLEQQVLDVKTQNEEYKCQNDKLVNCAKESRRKYRSSQLQLHILLDERTELKAKVLDQSRDLQNISQKLGQATLECKDLSEASSEKKEDDDDPDRPRFSLPELRDILQERNNLKAKISDLEDELSRYRPRPYGRGHTNKAPDDECMEALFLDHGEFERNAEESEGGRIFDRIDSPTSEEEDDADLPVQGPLPQDPDDAPWRKNESGIRKLFQRVFGKVLQNSDSPSISTLHRSFSKYTMR